MSDGEQETAPMDVLRPYEGVPVVLVHLLDGTTLDVCHIAQLAPLWVAIATFRDIPSCEQMDIEFVPYATIHRVTVSARSESERAIGFQIDHSSSAIKGQAPPPPDISAP